MTRTLMGLILSAALAQPVGNMENVGTGKDWTWTQQPDELIAVSLDFKPWLCADGRVDCPSPTLLTQVNTVTVSMIQPKTETPNQSIVSGTAVTGTKAVLEVNGSKTVTGSSYQIDINVLAADGHIYAWPVRLNSRKVVYLP